jgi:hypothetical protein
MARLAERNQILKLLDGWKMGRHLIENSNQSDAYNELERLKPAPTFVLILRRNRRTPSAGIAPYAGRIQGAGFLPQARPFFTT